MKVNTLVKHTGFFTELIRIRGESVWTWKMVYITVAMVYGTIWSILVLERIISKSCRSGGDPGGCQGRLTEHTLPWLNTGGVAGKMRSL